LRNLTRSEPRKQANVLKFRAVITTIASCWISPDIDAVTIATPNHLHAEMTIEALKARKHVLLEKPLATNSKDAARIVDAAKKSKRTLMVGQNFRFNRYTQMAKMIIDRHELGDVYHARCFWLRRNGIPRIGSWFTQKKFAGGGCAYDIGGICSMPVCT
jgi:predicted dehydrogenase